MTTSQMKRTIKSSKQLPSDNEVKKIRNVKLDSSKLLPDSDNED